MQNMELVRLVDVFLFLITMPILFFALYNVIRNIPYYVNGIGSMKENPEAYKFLGLLVNEFRCLYLKIEQIIHMPEFWFF